MSFWVKQPLHINDTQAKQILPAETLLEKINISLSESKSKLEYQVFTELDDQQLNTIISFINENYVSSDTTKLIYSKSLLQYFLKESLVLLFNPQGQSNKLVGLIVGKKKRIQVKDQEFNMIDVNFLCLIKKLRNLSLAPYLIASLTKESVQRFSISLAYYTISARINSPCFGKKQMYHRPINIAHLVNSGFIKVSIPTFERIYNVFDNCNEPIYLHNVDNPSKELIANLDDFIQSYNKKTYNIYDIKSIKDTIVNPSFHSFVFWDVDVISDFISIYRLDTQSNKTDAFYKNGYLFIVALKSDSADHLECVMNSVAKFCHENKIVDMLTLTDMFQTEVYSKIKFTVGTGLLNYYVFNMDMVNILNHENGLVTI